MRARIRTLDEKPKYVKIAVFGTWGSGKTMTVAQIARLGYRVFVLSTDIGGSGLTTVYNALADAPGLRRNVVELEISDYDTLRNFLDRPDRFYPQISSCDFLVWDGFSSYQHLLVGEWVAALNPGTGDPARVQGLKLEIQDWNIVRNATLRDLHDFLTLTEAHKLVTFQEGYRPKPVDEKGKKTVMAETKMPLLQGVAQFIAGAGFDLIVHTRVVRDPIRRRQIYYYDLAGHENLAAKQRGYNLPAEMEADFAALWIRVWPDAADRIRSQTHATTETSQGKE